MYWHPFSLSISLSLSRSHTHTHKHTHTHTHTHTLPDRVEQSVARLTQEAEVPGSIPNPVHTFVSPSTNSRKAVVSYWRKYVHEGLSLSRKSLVRLTNRPGMTIDVNRGRKIITHTNTLFPRGKSTIPFFA